MGAGGVMGAMTDFDIAYGIVAVDKTADGVNSAVSNTEKGTKSISEQFFFMSQTVNQAIAYIQQGFEATVGAALKWADNLKKMSDITGISTDDLQRLKAAGLETGVSLDSIVTAARMLTQRLGDAGPAGEALRKRLADLGVSTVDANGKLRSTNDIFWDTIKALNGIQDPMARNNLAVDTLGRGWAELAPMIRDYDEAAAAAAQVNPIDKNQIDRAHELGIEMDKLNDKMSKTGRNIGVELLPATEEWMDLIQGALQDGAPMMEFFRWLDGVLVLSARGFHIVAQESIAMWQAINKDFEGAKKTLTELGQWIQAQQTKDNLKKSGYFEGAVYVNGVWVNPNDLKDKTSVPAPTKAADSEDDRVKALTDAYKAYQDEVKKAADAKKALYDLDRDYAEDLAATGRDVAAARSLTMSHRRKERELVAESADTMNTAGESAAMFNAIKAGIPLAQVKGTDQYTKQQAISTTSLTIQNVNLSKDYTFKDMMKDMENYQSIKRMQKGM
jgi:hypothetical protein